MSIAYFAAPLITLFVFELYQINYK